MAKALWEQPITKNVNWGGDESTGGAAVSGQYVQQFIKDTLAKKFGYMFYNRANNKYFVFADQDDYNIWASNASAHADLVLASFDAPAPATIRPIAISDIDVTMLFGTDLKPLVFNYYIQDSSENVVAEDVIMRITATSKDTGAVKSEIVTIPYDLKTYNAKASYYKELTNTDANGNEVPVYPGEYDGYADADLVGSRYEYTRLNRLMTEPGNYSIMITLTTASTQVSSTLAFSYQLINLSITSDFNYLNGIDINSGIKEFTQNLSIIGANGMMKRLKVLVDGKPLKQSTDVTGIDANRLTSDDQEIGTYGQIDHYLEIFFLDKNNEPIKWVENGVEGDEIFTVGKHTLQIWAYIVLPNGTEISSKVLYYEFIVTSSDVDQTFLLYKADLGSQQAVGENIKLTGKQYSQINFTIGVFDSRKRTVQVKYNYDLLGEGESYTPINEIIHEIADKGEDEVKYTLRDAGKIRLVISNGFSDEKLYIDIESADSGVKIEEVSSNNLFKFSAENRSNDDPNRTTWENTSKIFGTDTQYMFPGLLSDRINFASKADGWTDDDALTLRNNATVKFDGINLFNLPGNARIEDTGWTFEIDFETFNVQNDEASILDFSDNYNSKLTINATSASLTTMSGTSIKTNFKEGERIKLAFIINPLKNVDSRKQYDPDILAPDDNPNTIFIMANGVLDRVVKWGKGETGSDSMRWANPTGPNATSFTIGNTTGEANVKVYSIRIYNRALTLDEEFMNYMYDQPGDKLIETYEKNNVFSTDSEGKKYVDFNLIKSMIPTMVMSMDYLSFGSFDATKKKANTFAEVQYFDPNDQELNFYARQCWISPQGTSSMSYPIKNLRLYLGKAWNSKTFQVINQIQEGDDRIEITNQLPIDPEFETEFWPFSEYGLSNEDPATIRDWADQHLPYATNKKVDTTDGSSFLVNGSYEKMAVHYGYHKIGANRTLQGKLSIIKNYLNLSDEDKEYDYKKLAADQKNGVEITSLDNYRKNVSLYIVNPPAGMKFGDNGGKELHQEITKGEFADKANTGKPIIVKDAFDNEYTIYSTSGIDGYIKNDDGSYSSYRTEETDAAGETINSEIVYDSFIELNNDDLTDDVLRDLLAKYDVFISAYRPLLRKGEALGSDSYKTYLDELRYSGVALYAWDDKKKKFKKNKGAIDYNTMYFTIGANWRQYNEPKQKHISGWTDRWTLKADYAESSMCHNAGVGRLIGNALKKVVIGGKYACQTEAQKFVNDSIDIRTSCDGKPIVIFYNQIQYFDGNNGGRPEYAATKFAGLFNIMTDKSSTKLFGFEDITDPTGLKWSAKKTECWECLNNGSDLVKGLSTEYDSKTGDKIDGYTGVKKSKLGEDRPLWGTYESRWPDTGQERHEYNPKTNPLGNNWPDDVYGVDTKNLESFLRWVNFCKPALNYTIGNSDNQIDGYKAELYKLVDKLVVVTYHNKWLAAKDTYESATATDDEKKAAQAEMKDYQLYMKWEKSGNTVYSSFGETYERVEPVTTYKEEQAKDEEGNLLYWTNDSQTEQTTEETEYPVMITVEKKEDVIKTYPVEWGTDEQAILSDWYTFSWRVDMEVVSKTINEQKIGKKVYLVDIPSFDAKYRCDDADGNYIESESRNHMVKTYVFPKGDGTYEYVDNFGETQNVTAGAIDLDPDNEHKISLTSGTNEVSCSGLTYMQYFSATKREHLDLEKVAAYYIYLIRFAAVDQVVKNSMMTTEDGKKYYFINYDNDTTLGVRNDGYLIYNWDIDRNTYDSGINGYAFAGAQSVLWNNLEADEEFMNLVKEIDNALNKQGLLSAEAVLTMFNEKQEGVWCQRLYNEQEKTKYLSTVKKDFSTDKYLGFMHGTRHSHRSWWVNHRWELYDAKWSSGMYSMKQMSFIYVLSASTSSPQDMMIITAASKYFFTMIRNTALTHSDWFKELEANKTGVYTIRVANSVGDPIFFYGPQKLKILNLRPNANAISRISLAEPYTVTQGDGTTKTSDWVEDDGSLMTKLLIGFNDTDVSSTAVDISGLDKILSLEEIDIRGMQKLNGGVPNIKPLPNLHRWRAKNSNATTFTPALGVQLHEVSLSQASTTTIELDGAIFSADSNEYVPMQTHMISGSAALNANDDVDGDETRITKFGAAFGDILPTYNNFSAYKYCKSYDEETNTLVPNFEQLKDVDGTLLNSWTGDYVFDYAPTKTLSRVMFNNVKGIDTWQFLVDWKAAIKEARLDTKNFKAIINGVEWVIEDEYVYDEEGNQVMADGKPVIINAVDKLIDMHNTFDFTDDNGDATFGGKAYIRHFNDAPLTSEEYDRLIAEFGADTFKSKGNFRINCSEGMFITITGGTKVEDPSLGGNFDNKVYYNVVQGNSFKVNAALFPISDDQSYVYVLTQMPGFNNPRQLSGPTGEKGKEVFGVMNDFGEYAVQLKNENNEGIVTINPDIQYGLGANDYFAISVQGYLPDGKTIDPNKNYTRDNNNTVYFKIAKRVMPTEAQLVAYDVTDNENPTKVSLDGDLVKSEIVDSNVHEFAIKFNNVTSNVKVSKFVVSLSTNLNIPVYELAESAAKLIPYDDKGTKYVDIDNEHQEYKFKISHDVVKYLENNSMKVYFSIEFENGIKYTNRYFDYSVNCIYIADNTNINFYEVTKDGDKFVIGETPVDNISINKVGKSLYKVGLPEHNIRYDIHFMSIPNASGLSMKLTNLKELNGEETDENEINDVIEISANCASSVNIASTLIITVDPDSDITSTQIIQLVKELPFNLSIIYPDLIELSYQDVDSQQLMHANSNLAVYSNPLILNMSNGRSAIGNNAISLKFNVKSKTEGNVIMPYALKITKIQLNTNSAQVFESGMTITDYTAMSGSNGTIVLTAINAENKTQFGGNKEVDSVDHLNLEINGLENINSTATIKLTCELIYDNDITDEIEEKNFMFDEYNSSNKTKEVEFTFNVTRSIASAVTWQKLDPIDKTEGKYILYLVDNLNRFYEIDVNVNNVEGVRTFSADSSQLASVKAKSGVSINNWRGIGFRIGNSDPSTAITSGDNQDTAPIFVSFKQWLGYNWFAGDNEFSNSTASGNQFKYNGGNNGRFNGKELTQIMIANASSESVVSQIWNTYDDVRLYVPSYKELNQLVLYSTDGLDNGNYMKALSTLATACITNGMIETELIKSTDQQYESVDNIDKQIIDLTTMFGLFGSASQIDIRYCSSSVTEVDIYNNINMSTVRTRRTTGTDSVTYSARLVSITPMQDANGRRANIFMPFVAVK